MNISFNVAEVRIVSQQDAGDLMGKDWVRRHAEVPMSLSLVCVVLTSNVDLAEYINKKHTGLSVSVYAFYPKRREIDIVSAGVYNGGKNVIHRKIQNEGSVKSNGVYQYQVVLWTNDASNEIVEMLKKKMPVCLKLRASDMMFIRLSKDIVLKLPESLN